MKIDTVNLEKREQAWEQAEAARLAREQQKRKAAADDVSSLVAGFVLIAGVIVGIVFWAYFSKAKSISNGRVADFN